MKLRKMAIAALAAVGVGAVPASAPAQIDNSIITQVGAMLLAQQLGIDPNLVLGLTSLLGGNPGYQSNPYGNVFGGGNGVFDLAPILLMQQHAPSYQPADILNLRRQGMSWDQIASRTGIDQSDYQRLRASGQLDPNYWGRRAAMDDFGLPQSTVDQLRARGMSYRDIMTAAIISRESGASIGTVANTYAQTHNWGRVSSYFGVSKTRLQNQLKQFRTTRRVPDSWRTNKNVPKGNAYGYWRKHRGG